MLIKYMVFRGTDIFVTGINVANSHYSGFFVFFLCFVLSTDATMVRFINSHSDFFLCFNLKLDGFNFEIQSNFTK